MKKILLYILLLLSFSNFSFSQDGWENLLSKEDLSNFKLLNGTASYLLEDGELVGISKINTPNSFLITKEHYNDFILEFEVLIENGLNSGVQIRSQSKESYQKGRVHGYQVEIETSDRKWAGGIYDEARRGWMYPLSRNQKGQMAWISGQWNHFRIEAIGHHLKTWVNGVQCANLVDDMTAKGFIGFQVHGIGNNKKQEGKKVRWRNIRIKTTDLEEAKTKDDPSVPEINYMPNNLTKKEIRKGWKLLWDGHSDAGWRGAKLDHFPKSGWTMEDGILKVLASDGGESANGGDIVTIETYSNFELVVDFKITKGANSGIKYFVDPELNKGEGSAIGLEFQILDDNNHPDAEKGVNGNRKVASLYDLIRAENISETSNKNKRFKGIGAWNRARIVVKGSQVEHWLNGVKMVEFNRHSQVFKALVEKSKYVVWPNFGQLPDGHILLQDHGDEVWFRNVKIREF